MQLWRYKYIPVKKFNLSKAADIQPKTLLKSKLFYHRYFARFLFGILSRGCFRTKQPNQPSVIMQPGKFLKPVTLAMSFSRYAWRRNASLVYGMAISLLFIWVNLKIYILVIQERCFANFSSKKISYFSAHSAHVEKYQTLYKLFWKQPRI